MYYCLNCEKPIKGSKAEHFEKTGHELFKDLGDIKEDLESPLAVPDSDEAPEDPIDDKENE